MTLYYFLPVKMVGSHINHSSIVQSPFTNLATPRAMCPKYYNDTCLSIRATRYKQCKSCFQTQFYLLKQLLQLRMTVANKLCHHTEVYRISIDHFTQKFQLSNMTNHFHRQSTISFKCSWYQSPNLLKWEIVVRA